MAIDVFLYDEHANGEVKNVKPGDFVLLSNVHAQPAKVMTKEGYPKISFVVHKGRINGRGVLKLPQDSQYVKEILGQIESLKCNKSVSNNQTTTNTRALETSCTITDFPLISFTTIEDIKKCPSVPNKFRCRVKAISFLPKNVKDFVQMYCPSCRKVTIPKESKAGEDCQRKLSESDFDSMDSRSECSQDEQAQDMFDKSQDQENSFPTLGEKCFSCDREMSFVYVFSLLIEDATGLLHVMLFNEDAKQFLTDLPSPESFLINSEIQRNTRETLTSITDNVNNELDAESQPCGARPWMECCVFSYHVPEQGVLYRIFGTTVV
ncbi:Protection of telomeres protein 1 [Exaiptasia diaphana]|nr:Protection of telomeres protein 1 [Exaiptasia diaphana]